MSPRELDRLDPGTLNDNRLADAFTSASYLQNDERSARFAEALADRGTGALALVDRTLLFAVLVRQALHRHGPSQALAWLDLAQRVDDERGGGDARVLLTWRAEVFARSNDPDQAAVAYQTLAEQVPLDPEIPYDAAETLLDQGYPSHARSFARLALARARDQGDSHIERLARRMLGEDA